MKFAWTNIRHINSYRVLRISADEAREQRSTQKGKQSRGLHEYDANHPILWDDMAEMFKDGFIDRVQNSIHALECCNLLEPYIASNSIPLDPASIFFILLRHVYTKDVGSWCPRLE
jgi:hypothetical protein